MDVVSHADTFRASSRASFPDELLLKRAGSYVDQSQRASRFWKCTLDPEDFAYGHCKKMGFHPWRPISS